MFCRSCEAIMKRTMRFEPGKMTQLFKCPKCYFESKAKPLRFEEEAQPRIKQVKSPAKNTKKKQKRCKRI